MKDIRQKLLATFQIEHRDHVEQIRSLLAMIETAPERPQGAELDEAFRRAHSLKGAARAVDLHPVEGLAHRLETLFSRVRQGLLPLDKSVSSVVEQALDASEDCVMALGDHRPTPGFKPALRALEEMLQMESGAEGPAAADSAPVGAPAGAAAPVFQPLETVRITAHNFDGLLRSAGGLLGEGQRQNELTGQIQILAQQIAALKKEMDTAAGRRPAGAPGAYRESANRQMDALARQARVVQHLHRRSSWTIRRLGKQLQLDVWRARMVAAESLLEGYRKSARDLAQDQGKSVEFRANSTDIQADRRVLEALKDPLLHLLRNAVSHGIELPQDREAKGKPPMGLVSLRIGSAGPRLTIVLEDDGRGVDFARAAEVAVREGILSESEAAACPPGQLAAILFRAGFSTAPAVTELSGRGMGLSVVEETVRRLRGTVELRPREGGGTAIHLSVPLSISTHKLLLVNCCGQPYAFPMHAVERLRRIPFESVTTVEGQPVAVLDGGAVRLFSLRRLLGIDGSATAAPRAGEQTVLPVAVLRLKSGRAAVAVDGFLAESDAVVQDLGPAARAGVSGAILLEDGRIAMVIEADELIHGFSSPEGGFFQTDEAARMETPGGRREPQRGPASILVVDDSMTTRTLEKSILEASGYRVRVAVNGVEALACLDAEKADLVITDVQMPRMDGFDLLEAMKRAPGLEKIPVIVVTSLDRREDRERGLRLGADAYIVKRKFDQAELLAAIRQIL